jgi:hypothetical protein
MQFNNEGRKTLNEENLTYEADTSNKKTTVGFEVLTVVLLKI